MEISALKQKVDGLEKRERYQIRRIADLQSKIENYKRFLSFDEDFAPDEVEVNQSKTRNFLCAVICRVFFFHNGRHFSSQIVHPKF